MAKIYEILNNIYHRSNNVEKCLESEEKIFEILEKISGERDINLVQRAERLALLFHSRKDIYKVCFYSEKAIKLGEECIPIRNNPQMTVLYEKSRICKIFK